MPTLGGLRDWTTFFPPFEDRSVWVERLARLGYLFEADLDGCVIVIRERWSELKEQVITQLQANYQVYLNREQEKFNLYQTQALERLESQNIKIQGLVNRFQNFNLI